MKDVTFTVYLLSLLFLLPYGQSIQEDMSTWLEFQPMPGQPNSLTWEVPPGTLPFTGSYQFFAELSTPVLHLLSVVETQTGLTLAECHLAAPTSPQWRSFAWQIDAHSLQCNASSADAGNVPENVEHPLPPLPPDSHQPRSFLVRILPHGAGPFCMRNLIVKREFARGCPPKLNAAMTPSPAGGGLVCHQCSLLAKLQQHQEQQQSTRPRLQISKLPPSAERPRGSEGDESSISINEGDGRQQLGPNTQQPQHNPGRVSATGAVSGNSELGVPIAFPLFRPTHSTPTSASSLVTVSESHDSDDGGSDDEHLSRAAQGKYKFAGPLHSRPNTRQPFADAGGASGGNSQTSVVRHDPCPHFECKNGGRCVTSEDARPICLCQPGFTGLRCEVDLCAAIACPGSSECKFRGGRAICECKDGPAGDNCRLQMKQRVVSSINGGVSGAPPVIVCAHECANGGECVAMGGNNNVGSPMGGGVNGICRCAHGFLGANCNIRDLCADNATCALFGHNAKCFVDAASLETKAPVNFVNSPHVCMCEVENGQWVDCSQVVRRLDLNPSTPTGRVTTNGSHLFTPGSEVQETPHFGTLPKSFLEPLLGSPAVQQPQSSTNGPIENVEEPHRRFNPNFSGPPPPSATPTRRTSITPIRESGGTSEGGSVMHQQHRRPSSFNTQQPPFPIHVPTGRVGGESDSTQGQSTTSSQDDTSDDGSDIDSAGLQPRFPFTTPAPGILPGGQGPVRGRLTGGQTSSRLKVLSGSSSSTTTTTARSTVSTTTTQEPIITRPVSLQRLPPPGLGDEDEKAGDNGFERVTAHLDPAPAAAKSNSTPATTTTTTTTTRRPATTSPTTTTTITSAPTTTTRIEMTAPANTTVLPQPSTTMTASPPMSTLSTEPLFPHSTEESNHVAEVEESLDHTASPPVEVQTVGSFHPTDNSHHVLETSTVGGGGNSVMNGMGDEELGPTDTKAENGETDGNVVAAPVVGKDAQSRGQSGHSKSSNNEHLVMANNILSWIVAVGVIAFFLLSVASGTFCVGRYVRRSRRLHGKYNPAREETAAANTYSMPMTTVSDFNSKEERLI